MASDDQQCDRVRITDSSLRDGLTGNVRDVVRALDLARIPVVEVRREDVPAAVDAARGAKIACRVPARDAGEDDIRSAADLGVAVLRIVVNHGEVGAAARLVSVARGAGLRPVGLLPTSPAQPARELGARARALAEAGCDCVCVVDETGALGLDEVAERVTAVCDVLDGRAGVGFRGTANPGLGLINTIRAIRAGARHVDACITSSDAGHTSAEALITVCERFGIDTGADARPLGDLEFSGVGTGRLR